MNTANQHNLERTEATTLWFDERQAEEDRYWEEDEHSDVDHGDLRDDGRSDGYGESYSERNA